MFKKSLLLLSFLLLIRCGSSKPAIITTKGSHYKSKNEGSYSSKKSNSRYPKKSNSDTEIIESTSRTLVTSDVVNGYVFHYKDVAMKNMKKYGIPASIILAQGILESGAGQGNLAVTANNHFGIKCYKDWTGETVYHDDDSSNECFRKYKNPEESFQDHAEIVSKRTRYASLFSLPKDDYAAWAKGLRAAGYATDAKYPEKLISYIERYHLDQYDNQVLGKEYVIDKSQNATVIPVTNTEGKVYEVQKGDTLYSISKKFNILVEDLKQKNNLPDFSIAVGQQLIVK
ncbi:glucosaminidase domain-containing protein [Flavobacterium restrictum]|uniref:Peptidoglycan hydrolase n=1 Tax=Flavobacterium restrictum TaxID=2594428 RepID=A0A553E4T2_9FLAO|nr:glucosaminidase domain-containing protein [Flavobacterium restrictum]TRX40037.1 LysM peptidoglycan-binding domain-containing protein [Flavobacterium restrictum]